MEYCAKVDRLEQEIYGLENKQVSMVEGELENIEEQGKEEFISNMRPGDFVFDVSSEQVQLPDGVDWSALELPSEVTAGGSSSQSS